MKSALDGLTGQVSCREIQEACLHAGPACSSAEETDQQYRRQKALAAEKREYAAKHARPAVRRAHVLSTADKMLGRISPDSLLLATWGLCPDHLAEVFCPHVIKLWVTDNACLAEPGVHIVELHKTCLQDAYPGCDQAEAIPGHISSHK